MTDPSKAPTTAKPEWLSIKDAARYLAMNETYLRQLVRKGTIATKHEKVEGSETLWRHMIKVIDLESYRNNRGTRSRRTDGRGKFTIYLTADEVDKIHQLMPNLPIAKANSPEQAKKNYAKQKARKAAKKAAVGKSSGTAKLADTLTK
jgi:hypothetical protein